MLTVYILHQKTELLSNPYKLCTGTGKKQPFKFNTLMPLYITPVLQGGQISPMINSLFMATNKFAPLPLSPFPPKKHLDSTQLLLLFAFKKANCATVEPYE